MSLAKAVDGRRRAVIENITPSVDGGRYAAKRCIGDTVTVEADVFVDGHEELRCILLHRRHGEERWNESEMTFLVNDHWQGAFTVTALGAYEFTVIAWPDAFLTWRHDLARWTAVEDVAVALQVGIALLREIVQRAQGSDAKQLRKWIARLGADADPMVLRNEALDDAVMLLVERYADRRHATINDPPLPLWADPVQARFSAWQFKRVDIESDQPPTGANAFEDGSGVTAAAERAVDRHVPGDRPQALEHLADHDRQMHACRRLARRHDLLDIRREPLGVQFLVFFVECAGILPGVAHASGARRQWV